MRAGKAREAALERERARLEAEGEELRARLAERVREVDALAPYRPLVEAAEDWVWASDEDGTLTYSNPAGAELLGIDDLLGRSLRELTHSDDKPWAGTGSCGASTPTAACARSTRARCRPSDGWQGIDRDLTRRRRSRCRRASRSCAGRWSTGAARWSAYELVGDGDVLGGFPPAELLELGGGRPVWVTLDGDELPALDRDAHRPPDRARHRARAGRRAGGGRASCSRSTASRAPSPLLEHCGIVKVARRPSATTRR